MRSLFHFIGGVVFAIILIALTACMVIVGTFIEAKTESHRFAALFTYSSPLFSLLLCGFFLNILFAALRRWPFKKRHFPFLITHLGLLMVIGSTLIKQLAGVQGILFLREGQGSDTLFIPDTYVVQVEKQTGNGILKAEFPVGTKHHTLFPELTVNVLKEFPHSKEKFVSWIKNERAEIFGLQPIAVVDEENVQGTIPVATRVRFHHPEAAPWNVFALRSKDLKKTVERLYRQDAEVLIVSLQDQQILHRQPFADRIEWNQGHVELSVKDNSSIEATIAFGDHSPRPFLIPLHGNEALENKGDTLLMPQAIALEIERSPAIAFIEGEDGDSCVATFDPHGKLHVDYFSSDKLDRLFIYNEGFGGYGVQYQFPFPAYPCGRKELCEARSYAFENQLRLLIENTTSLTPPLRLLHTACKKAEADTAAAFVELLRGWKNSSGYFFSGETPVSETLAKVLSHLNWKSIPHDEYVSIFWASLLTFDLEKEAKAGKKLLPLLLQNQWPLAHLIDATTNKEILDGFTQQIFSSHQILPPPPLSSHKNSSAENARLFSAYLRAYGIDPHNTFPAFETSADAHQNVKEYLTSSDQRKKIELALAATDPITIETSLAPLFSALPPNTHLEENVPLIVVEIKEGEKKERVALRYDRLSQGFYTPALDGRYRLRFQPQHMQLPCRLRLRQARLIPYANSSQPFSYECELLITNSQGILEEKTVSMNDVYENAEGYRFYLSTISPPDETAVKRIQLAVNYDPMKYILLIPGTLLIALGIVLLFWRPFTGKKK